MYLPNSWASTPFSLGWLLLIAPSLVSSYTLDCAHVRIDERSYILNDIAGPHSVTTIEDHPPGITNTTWTIDLCGQLKVVKGTPKEDQCPSGTRVCGIAVSGNAADKTYMVDKVVPVAGNYLHEGRNLEPKVRSVRKSDEEEAWPNGGLEIELYGGLYKKQKQMAVVQLKCDPTRTGNEGNEDAADKRADEEEDTKREERRLADDDDDEEDDDNKKSGEAEKNSLRFISYEQGGDIDVLHLEWLTKHVCLSEADDLRTGSSGWGFFTWIIVILFMGTAAYLIFGSWLNYNRYGARGWDLLPHGDTIRDIPYLFRDWSRKVIDTVQGGPSRGGYSAV